MKTLAHLSVLLAATSAAHAFYLPETDLQPRGLSPYLQPLEGQQPEQSQHGLEKRKGGGGSRGGGGGGISSSGGGTRLGGSSSSSRGGSSSPISGGATRGGSGLQPSFAGGRYYGGGAAVPFTAGRASPRGLAPALLPVAAVALIFPGLWLYGAYAYGYPYGYRFYNQTAAQNETLPVQCLCQEYSVCACDQNDDPEYLNELVGNGSLSALASTARLSAVNGTRTLVLNGTLPNGTTVADPSVEEDSAASSSANSLLQHTGWTTTIAVVLYMVWFT